MASLVCGHWRDAIGKPSQLWKSVVVGIRSLRILVRQPVLTFFVARAAAIESLGLGAIQSGSRLPDLLTDILAIFRSHPSLKRFCVDFGSVYVDEAFIKRARCLC